VEAASRRAARGLGRGSAGRDTRADDLKRDPGERFDVAKEYPDVVARLRARLKAFEASLR
jgi:hypothetical protein